MTDPGGSKTYESGPTTLSSRTNHSDVSVRNNIFKTKIGEKRKATKSKKTILHTATGTQKYTWFKSN